VYAGLLDAKNAGIVDMWQTIHEKYDAAFDSSFGVYMAAYWYLWAVNKAALESKIKSLLGVSGNDYWAPTTTPIQKKKLLDKVGEAGSEKRKQISDLLVLYKNVFKSTELTIKEAENTYKEAYKNDVAKGVTLLPSLEYWAKQAAGAAPESIAPGASSRSGNTNRNAVPNYRGTSAGTSTTTTTTTTNGGGRGGSSVNGMAPGYQAASM
jgi:hypothetical protein